MGWSDGGMTEHGMVRRGEGGGGGGGVASVPRDDWVPYLVNSVRLLVPLMDMFLREGADPYTSKIMIIVIAMHTLQVQEKGNVREEV